MRFMVVVLCTDRQTHATKRRVRVVTDEVSGRNVPCVLVVAGSRAVGVEQSGGRAVGRGMRGRVHWCELHSVASRV